MRVLITAGGTIEKIDDVRNIKNTSTGRLGQVIADTLDEKVTLDYIHGKDALLPKRQANLIKIESVRDVEREITKALNKHKYDLVIHAMAISDYEITSVTNFENLDQNLDKDNIIESLDNYKEDFNRNDKIRSEHENLVVIMKKAPKIISLIKKLQEDTVLVGFKLLVDASIEELSYEAKKQIEKNNCDFVLANDLLSIKDDEHIGYLFNKDLDYEQFKTKQEIAKGILRRGGIDENFIRG